MIQEMEMNALVNAGIFRNKTEMVKEALRLLFATRPQLNVEAAVQLEFLQNSEKAGKLEAAVVTDGQSWLSGTL